MAGFKGKSVLMLGGSRGIGAAVRRFSADGATVAFTYAGSRGAAERLATEMGGADRDAVGRAGARQRPARTCWW